MMKPGVPIVVYSFCAMVLFVACANSADQQGDDKAIPPGTCKNVNILMASNASTGIQAVLTSTEDADVNSPPITVTIAGHYLPPECQVNHRCDILHFGHPSGTSHYIIPSIGGFVVLSHWADYDNHTEELPWNSFVDVMENCNPTKAFLARRNHIIIIACMDLQSRPYGILYYMHYNLLPNSTGSGWIVERNTALPTRSETIYNPTTVSEIIHVREQVRCQERDSLYFIDDGYVLRFPTSDTSDPEIMESDLDHPLENCMGYQSFEHYGNDSLVIRCSNNRTAFYDSCGNGRFTYAPDDNIPYPCTNWSTIVYRNGTQLTLDGATQLLPSGDISYGKCVQATDHSVFIALSADGAIFISRFDGNNFTKVTSSNCSNNNNIPCPRPVFSENENVFGTFDSKTHSFVIVNVTEGCLDDPVNARIPIPFQPDLISISLGQGTYDCSCSAVQVTEPLITTQTVSTLDVSLTDPTDSTMATNPSESSTSATTSSPSSSHRAPISTEGLLAGVLTLAVVLLFAVSAVIAAIILCLVYKCIWPCRVNKKDFLPTVKSPLQESPENQRFRMDPGNNAKDRSEEGCGSGETTTTTSLSESAEIASTISSGSECTVSIHSESGLPGGETHVHVPSKDILPFKPTQFGAQQLLEHHQSRTSDNKDREDMKNKVHIFQ